MTHVVVTGAAGFIGSHLVDRLLADGRRVVGIDSLTDYYDVTLKRGNLFGAQRNRNFTFHEGDLVGLLDPACELRTCFAGADCVFHLAAQAGVRASWGSSFRMYAEDNVIATQAVLETCVAMRVPTAVYASSSSVYGDAQQMPLSENTLCRPVSPYGVTKLAGEHLFGLYAKACQLHTVSLRFFTVFGPRQRPDMAFNKFMRGLLAGRPIDVYGDGTQTRDFTFVADIVEGIVRAPSAPRGAVINLGGGQRVTLLEALETLAQVTGYTPVTRTKRSQPGDARDTWADIALARRYLDFAPRVGLAEGLAAEWEWLTGLERSRPSGEAGDQDHRGGGRR